MFSILFKYLLPFAICANLTFAQEEGEDEIEDEIEALPIQAPVLTNKHFFEEFIIAQEGTIPIPIQGQIADATYVEVDNLGAWLQGKQTATNYINNVLMNGHQPLQAQILNPNNQFVLVDNNNTGMEKLFPHLNHTHYGKLACKYRYSIPDQEGIIYGDYGRQLNIQQTYFSIYLLLDSPLQLRPQEQILEQNENQNNFLNDEEYIQDVIRNINFLDNNFFQNIQYFNPQMNIPQQIVVHQQIMIQPFIPEGHTVKMYKGKQWLFKGNTPVREYK
jgi:hypothetical protein